MLATIRDNQWIYVKQVVGEVESLLVDHFSVKHKRAQFIDVEQQHWDGWYRKYDQAKQRLALPLLQELKDFAAKHDVPLEIQDLRDPPEIKPDKSAVKADMLGGIILQDHQIRAINAACDNPIGLISAVTGAGKTEIMAGIVKAYSCPTVIMADQRVVIEQIKQRLELRDIVDEVGLFYGGETPSGQMVVVGSIASLTSPPSSMAQKDLKRFKKRKENAEKFQEIVRNAGLLLVDEADKATDKRYRKLFKNYFQGRYKYGFSGTCFDPEKPVEALVLKENLGSIIIDITRRELEEAGRIIPIKGYMIAVGADGDKYDRTIYDVAEKECMIENREFHQTVKSIVDGFPNDRTLILVDTNNVELLGVALENTIPGSKFIYGKTSKTVRQRAIKDFEEGTCRVLIGGRILKRGLDLKGGVDNVIVCGNGKLTSDFDQKVGRAVRQNAKGWARLFFFLHLNNYYLYKHSKIQLQNVLGMGYGVQVVVNGHQIEGSKFVSSKFKIPK
jgi:superfamily II DNA or RNA helicase